MNPCLRTYHGKPGKQGSMGAPNSGCMFAGLLEMSSLEQTQTKPPNSLGIFFFFGFLGLLQDLIVYVFIKLLFCCCCWLLWVFVAKCELSLAAVLSGFSNCSTRTTLVDSQVSESLRLSGPAQTSQMRICMWAQFPGASPAQ